jgi:hypothetical protein
MVKDRPGHHPRKKKKKTQKTKTKPQIMRPFLSNTRSKKRDLAEAVECLPSKCKTLNSNLSTVNKVTQD